MLTRRALALASALLLARPTRAAGNDDAIEAAIRAIMEGDDEPTEAALAQMRALRDPASIAPLIQMLFWTDETQPLIETLETITGAQPGSRFFDWMVWQQDHPENTPYGGYEKLISELFNGLDSNYARFFWPGIKRAIRVEELVWGGVKVNGIPPLDRPKTTKAADATWLADDDRVFGVFQGGEARAYPVRILNWHEMANDVVGGVPVTLSYCPLCGAGVLYDGRVPGAPDVVTFATSGLLYRSNKLMFDRISESLWNQFTGRPVIGQLVGMDVALTPLPMVLEPWSAWRARHPDTTVLSLDTGVTRDYASEGLYKAYAASPNISFPAAFHNRTLAAKDRVFGLRAPGGVRAWPLARFAQPAILHDRVGLLDVVLIGEGESIRAYESAGRRFTRDGDTLRDADGSWTIEEMALRGPAGQSLARLPGQIAYWFAWNGYFGDTLAP